MKEFNDFMATKKENAELTKKSYSTIIGKFLSAMEVSTIEDLKALKYSDLQSYINGLEVKPNTKNSVIRVLKVFYNFLFDWEYIENNPMSKIKRQKVGKKVLKMPTIEEMEIIYSNCNNEVTLLMINLMSRMGLRRSELTTIEISDIHENGKLLIRGKGNKQAVLKMPEDVFAGCKKYLSTKRRAESKFLFSFNGHKVSPISINKRIKEYVCSLPLSEERKKVITPHSFRHRAGSNMYNKTKNPYNVRDFLRHSNLQIGETYVHTESSEIDMLSESM
jgi:integrase/recombinase XerD